MHAEGKRRALLPERRRKYGELQRRGSLPPTAVAACTLAGATAVGAFERKGVKHWRG